MKKIGVIGCGVVGTAVGDCFRNKGFSVYRYDKFKHVGKFAEVASNADVIFVCVPTPTIGFSQDLEPIHDVCSRLQEWGFKGAVVIKSTVVPGTMDKLQSIYIGLDLIHNPEFLTEANAATDFVKQTEVLLSGPDADKLGMVIDVYRSCLIGTPVRWFSDFKATELAKYIHNTFLATKVAFMNQMHDYAKAIGASYEHAISGAIGQGVIGASHTKIAMDGKKGFGGMCFIKDTEALIESDNGELLTILASACIYNERIRPSAYNGEETNTGYKQKG